MCTQISQTGCLLTHLPLPPAGAAAKTTPEASLSFLLIAFLFLCLPFCLCQNESDGSQLPCCKMWTKRSRHSLVVSGRQNQHCQGSYSWCKGSGSSPELLSQKSWGFCPETCGTILTVALELQLENSVTRSELHCVPQAFLSLGCIPKWHQKFLSRQVGSTNLLFPPVTATKRQTSPSWTVGKAHALLWDPCLCITQQPSLKHTACGSFPLFSVPPGIMIC